MNIKFNIDKGRQVFESKNITDLKIENTSYKGEECLKVYYRYDGERHSVYVYPQDGDTYELTE